MSDWTYFLDESGAFPPDTYAVVGDGVVYHVTGEGDAKLLVLVLEERGEFYKALEGIDWYCNSLWCCHCDVSYPDKKECIGRRCEAWDIRRYVREALGEGLE